MNKTYFRWFDKIADISEKNVEDGGDLTERLYRMDKLIEEVERHPEKIAKRAREIYRERCKVDPEDALRQFDI